MAAKPAEEADDQMVVSKSIQVQGLEGLNKVIQLEFLDLYQMPEYFSKKTSINKYGFTSCNLNKMATNDQNFCQIYNQLGR